MFPVALFNTLMGVEAAELGIKIGMNLGLDKPGLGGKLMSKLRGIKAGAIPAGASVVGAAGRATGTVAEAAGPLASKAWAKGKVAGAWTSAKGSQAFTAFKGSPRAQKLAAIGGMAALGYATSDSDASTGQKLGRAAAFGFIGSKGYSTFSSSLNRSRLGESFAAFGNKQWKRGGQQMADALGLPAKWGMKQSIAAGAFYGAMSSNATILGGAATGAVLDIGIGRRRTAPMEGLALSTETKGRGLLGLYGGTATKVKDAYKKDGLIKAFKAAPLMKTGMYAGAMKGAYSSMQEGDTGGVVTGALGGGVKGAALGGAARFGTSHPFVTLGGYGTYSAAAEGIRSGVGQVREAGAPGFDTMNADGDLALALHKMRHG